MKRTEMLKKMAIKIRDNANARFSQELKDNGRQGASWIGMSIMQAMEYAEDALSVVDEKGMAPPEGWDEE